MDPICKTADRQSQSCKVSLWGKFLQMNNYTLSSRELKARAIYTKAIANNTFRFLVRLALLVAASATLSMTTNAQKNFNNVDANGVILDGYDAVAFFTDNKPVKGDAKFQYKYQDAIYYFASQDHLDLFVANPEKYRPQFGAWCAYAVSLGRIAPIDVNTFSIVNDRLFIQHNERAVKGWNKDVPGNIVKADNYWPAVSSKHGKQITTDEEKAFLNNTDADGVTLQGYDAVSYFTEMKAIKGDPKFFARYNGATYWFSSEQNAIMFKDHPEMFAPQYGAFCGYAMALNKLRPINPEIFDIIDGKLILQHSDDAYRQFHKDIPGNVMKANNNWPGQVQKHAGKKVKYDKAAKPVETGRQP
jgi:YHS domain-containing protein